MALVSICIPTYNGAPHLASCLASAQQQTERDLEIIVNDDGSTDTTLAIARDFARRDPRIRVLANAANLGLVGNWNRTIEQSTTPWVKLLFQDDRLHPACVRELCALSAAHELPFVACFRDVEFDEDVGEDTRAWFAAHAAFVERLFTDPIMRPGRVAETCLNHFARNFVGEPIVTMLHRRVFDEVGFFDTAIAQRADTEFCYRAGLRYGVGMVRQPLATFRFHHGSTSARNLGQRPKVDKKLDPLIILYRCLHDPHYERARAVARERGQLDALQQRFKREARSASRSATLREDPGFDEEWQRVVAAYPGLATEAAGGASRPGRHSLRRAP